MKLFFLSIFTTLFLLPLALSSIVSSSSFLNFKEIKAKNTLQYRKDIVKHGRAPAEHRHKIVFAIEPKHMDVLIEVLYNVSTPHHPHYGRHWSKQQVTELIQNKEGYDALTKWLSSHPKIEISETTRYLDYVTAHAPVNVWESMLNCHFHDYEISSIGPQPKKLFAPNFIPYPSTSMPMQLPELYNFLLLKQLTECLRDPMLKKSTL
jgi:hypothetical protein